MISFKVYALHYVKNCLKGLNMKGSFLLVNVVSGALGVAMVDSNGRVTMKMANTSVQAIVYTSF